MGLSRRATVSHLRVIPVTTGIVAEKQGTRAEVATRFRAGQSGNPKGRPSRKVAARRSTACAESYRSNLSRSSFRYSRRTPAPRWKPAIRSNISDEDLELGLQFVQEIIRRAKAV